ncbi:hypothetical protein EDB80DRAFT_701279, partial [Ilyonectria destructans]
MLLARFLCLWLSRAWTVHVWLSWAITWCFHQRDEAVTVRGVQHLRRRSTRTCGTGTCLGVGPEDRGVDTASMVGQSIQAATCIWL